MVRKCKKMYENENKYECQYKHEYKGDFDGEKVQ